MYEPCGSDECPDHNYDWRYAFPRAERVLFDYYRCGRDVTTGCHAAYRACRRVVTAVGEREDRPCTMLLCMLKHVFLYHAQKHVHSDRSRTSISEGESVGAASVGAVSVGAVSVGAVSVGAASVGAASVGAASVGAASVGADSQLYRCANEYVCKLLACAETRKLHHYFMPRVNVLEAVGAEELDVYVQVLKLLKANLCRYLHIDADNTAE